MSKRYKFNEYGVCINPDESAKIGSGMTLHHHNNGISER